MPHDIQSEVFSSMKTSTTTTTTRTQTHDHFYDIIESFQRVQHASHNLSGPCPIDPPTFLEAIRVFLRIFDALGSPFFVSIVRSDILRNIHKLETALRSFEQAEEVDTLGYVVIKEIETGVDSNEKSGTIALLWIKRVMEFVHEIILGLVEDSDVELRIAARTAYGKTLRFCHGFAIRALFETGILLSPTRAVFYRNLMGGVVGEKDKVQKDFKEFLQVLDPVLQLIVSFYQERNLEKFIPPNS